MMQKNNAGSAGQKILTVSQITDEIKALLESKFPFVWITGEISNLNTPMSGHCYFSLKDESAQISAVMFRGQNRRLPFQPKDGMAVIGLGRISLYKPRGTYQIIFEYLEPKGIGALQVAFEQLKAKLADEGLFDDKHKKSIPFLPQKVALITSPTGAVLQDILKISRRRFKNIHIVIIPVKVQGAGADQDIVRAIEMLNIHGETDVAIIARGGGSLEDLQAFNSEPVARAIVASRIPIVSAVGHETDYTISDFVADYRAPTPSAAAEIVFPEKHRLRNQYESLERSIYLILTAIIREEKKEISNVSRRLIDPRKRIQDFKLRCDDITGQLIKCFRGFIRQQREQIGFRIELLNRVSPKARLVGIVQHLDYVRNRLMDEIYGILKQQNYNQKMLAASLRTLNPLSVLDRGYSITRTIPRRRVVKSHEQVDPGGLLEILLSKGSLEVSVTRKMRKSAGDLYIE